MRVEWVSRKVRVDPFRFPSNPRTYLDPSFTYKIQESNSKTITILIQVVVLFRFCKFWLGCFFASSFGIGCLNQKFPFFSLPLEGKKNHNAHGKGAVARKRCASMFYFT